MDAVLFPAQYLEQCFSSDYQSAQARFKIKAQELANAASYEELLYPETGPQGEALSTGLVWQGDPQASKVLVVQSATHGVEGFAGSAIQLDTLSRIAEEGLPEQTAILYLHAINPFGFAWLRRTNEKGVDLNRNFIDFNQPLPENAGYVALADALLPASPDQRAAADYRLGAYRKEQGQRAYELAVSGGQYQFSDGLFFGGTEPSRSRLHLEELFLKYDLNAREKIAVVDIHTGLGPFAYGELICDHAPDSVGLRWAREWFGESVTEPAAGTSSSVPKHGLIDYLWQRKLHDKVCFVTLEYGTYSVDEMFEVLRQDHLLHRGSVDWQGEETKRIKSRIRKFFYPETTDWQEMVLLRGRQVLKQAIRGLMS